MMYPSLSRIQLAILTLPLLLASSACLNPTDSPTENPADPLIAKGLSNPSWDIQYQDSTTRFIGLFAVDDQTVWAAGTGGKFARTADGGETWFSGAVAEADSLGFRDIHAFDNRTAYVLSIGNLDNSRIYRTDDGGLTWDLQFKNQDPNSFFDCFSF